MNHKIAFICDLHLDEKNPEIYGVDPKKNWKQILDDIKQRNINDIIFGGDIGASTAYAWFFKSLEPFNYEIIMGNHDTYQDASNYYRRGIDKSVLFFSKNLAGYKFIFLDTSAKVLSKNQLIWLSEELRTDLKIVIFIHHPVLGVDTPIDSKHPLQNRNEVLKVLAASQKNIDIFSGHYHMNDERIYGKVRQVITLSSVFQVIKEADEIEIDASFFGYRIITFGEESISSETVSI
ncbi:metallophosphoesterase family protein [Lutimonas zeaxanthinifaciens]|uniref:metallophosphoesterase family protein n=1 Tax=Lutimonas zeaxanthinifaciens TaxID=3060215 RepID=UPI00265CE782|nr:metallophosphoesterase [Lutimonas sp. YSD2104]WKK66253.1 metallophosphoesterase [Lutimonas sp. YSD2104]